MACRGRTGQNASIYGHSSTKILNAPRIASDEAWRRISDAAFEVETISRCWVRSFNQGFGRFVAARGDMLNIWVVVSILAVILAVPSVFIEIPIISNYAFWFVIAAYLLLAGSRVHFR